jgi:hypothetical protein
VARSLLSAIAVEDFGTAGAADSGGALARATADRKLPNLLRIVFSLGVIPVAVHASAVGWTPNFSKKARIEVSASSSRSSEESRNS